MKTSERETYRSSLLGVEVKLLNPEWEKLSEIFKKINDPATSSEERKALFQKATEAANI